MDRTGTALGELHVTVPLSLAAKGSSGGGGGVAAPARMRLSLLLVQRGLAYIDDRAAGKVGLSDNG